MAMTLIPRRIAVVGCGNIGSTFAFYLAGAGHDVTAIARPDSRRLAQLRRDGAVVDVNGRRADLTVADALDTSIPYDLVIVTLLAHQVAAVMPSLQASAATSIQFMFNTFAAGDLAQVIGERCTFGMPFVQATLDPDGKLKATVGAGGQKTLVSEQRWVDLFSAAGLPAALEPRMPLWLRCHAPMCVAFESVSIARMRRGAGASWREALALARGVHACFRLIEALGDPIYPQSKRMIDRSPASAVAALLWTMSRIRGFRELLATGRAECEALIDTMLEAAPASFARDQLAPIQAMRPS